MSVFDSTGGIGRREFVAFGVGAFVVGGLPLAVVRRRDHPGTIHRTLPMMGTIVDVAVVHRDPQAAEVAIDAAVAEMRWVERTMTRFDDRSDVGRANLAAARGPVLVTPETALVVAEALRWASATAGTYDPAAGKLVKLWDVNHRHEPPPEPAQHALAGRALFNHVEVGTFRGQPALLFHDPDVSLDLGAIAKGYAVDRAIEALRRQGITKAVVDAGGDLYALGTAADGEPWRIGIRDPHDTRALAATLHVADAAIGTSGTYMQFFRYRGVRYHHLMDPHIGAPRQTTVQSYTVRADRNLHADVAASALFGMSPAAADAVLARLVPGAAVINMLS